MENFIEFPVFDGVSRDLRQWIAWLEDFFVRERFTGDEKMNLAQSLLEGEANAWFYSSRKHFSFQSWEHLVVELLLWRFGYFGDGGVFSDLELFLLWDKYDRILRKRRKRLSRTAINPQESISSPATIHETVPIDKFSTPKVDEISGEKIDESHEATLVKVLDNLEEASVTQNQVPVSKLEPSLQIPKDSPNVCENSQAVVGCEHQRSFQKNIRMDVVNGVVERSQRVMSITKNVSAHQVLDKMCQLKRLKPKNKRKLHLSLKTWMFKFKNKNLQHNWSQRDLHQVIDISKVNNLSPCVSATFGLVRKHRTFQCLRLKKQAHKSRVQYHLRRLHDPGGNKDEHPDAIFETEVDMDNVQRTPMDTVAVSVTTPDTVASSSNAVAPSTNVITERQRWDEACDAEIDALEGTGTSIVTSLPANKIPIGCKWLLQLILDDLKSHLRHKWKFEVAAYSLSFDVDTEENISSGLSPTSQVWEPGGVLAEHVLVDWLVDFNGYDGIVDGIRRPAIDSRRASRVWERGGLDISTFVSFNLQSYSSWCGWMVFDRGKTHIISGGVITRVFLDLKKFLCEQVHRVSCLSLPAQFHSLEFQLKHKWRSKHFHTISALEFYLSSVFPIVTSANSCSGCKRMNEKLQVHTILIVVAVKSQVKNKWRLVWRIWRLHNQWLVLLPQESKIHKVFHVSQLQAVLGDHQQVHTSVPSELLAEDNWIPEAVLDVRFDAVGRREFLILWPHQDSSANSGLLSKEFVRLFPSFKLEDKLGLQGVSIDTIQCLIVGIDDVARVKMQTEDSE